jgi:hypothetical protein
MGLLRDNLQPTDFADADCRVTDWTPFKGYNGCNAYRLWMCKCTHHWFQRHEWAYEGRNQTEMDEWLYVGYHHRKEHAPHYKTAPDVRDL